MRSDKPNETGSDDSESEDEDQPGDNDHEDLDKGDGSGSDGDGSDEGIDEGDGLDGPLGQVPDKMRGGGEGGYKDSDPMSPPPDNVGLPERGPHPMLPPDLVALPRLAEASPEVFAAAAEIEAGTSLSSRGDDGELAASLSREGAEAAAGESERAAAGAAERAASRSREMAEQLAGEGERALARLHDRSKSAE